MRGRPASLVDLVLGRAEAEPDQVLYRFAGSAPVLTAERLADHSRAIAQSIAHRWEPGERILLLLPTGPSFVLGFFGCQLAGVVPVPVAPPGRARLAQGLMPALRIAADCDPVGVLAPAAMIDAVGPHLEAGQPLPRADWMPLEDALTGDARTWAEPPPDDARPAVLQYTSGTLGAPRGVRVLQRNLLANLRAISSSFATSVRDHGVIWLPPHHDMGLVGGILTPLHDGFDVTLLPAVDVVQSPVRWLRAITERGGTISGGPDFAYRACVERIRDDQMAGLDLSSWRVAFTGAEPISSTTLDRFAERFASVGFDRRAFYPCYGLAESTLIVTGGRSGAGARTIAVSRDGRSGNQVERGATTEGVRTLVGCGGAADAESEVLVVDPATRQPQPGGTVGEVWVAGPSVADGYHGHAELTAETFQVHLADGRGPFLRTGDLGLLDAGDLFITGRAKDVVIVLGRNLDAEDIESSVRRALGGRRHGLVAAFGRSGVEREDLVVLIEAGRREVADRRSIERDVRSAVSVDFGVRIDEVHLLPLGSLPRTTSGKAQRQQAREQLERGALAPDLRASMPS